MKRSSGHLRKATGMAGALVAGLSLAMPAGAQDGGRLALNPMQNVEKSKLKAFVQQPLFNPARALPAAPAPVAFTPPTFVVPPSPPPNIQLVGVIEGINAVAIVRNGASTSMLHTGERLGAWTITILPGGLRLTNGDRTFDYTLFSKAGGSPSTVSPAPAAAQSLSLGGPPLPDRPNMPP